MTAPRIPLETISYKTYVKRTIAGALRGIFADHPATLLRDHASVDVDFPFTKAEYPSVVIRFYERNIQNIGVGHYEFFQSKNLDNTLIKYKHFLYQGDIEFAIYALSTLDRDLMSDSIVQILTMGELQNWSGGLYQKLYRTDFDTDPLGATHFINLNTNQVSGFGETQVIAPWMPEDVMVYQTSYRVGIHGEIYSPDPTDVNYGTIQKVELYPYDPDAGETQPNPDPSDPAPWV